MFDTDLSSDLEWAQQALDDLEAMPLAMRELFACDEAHIRRWKRALEAAMPVRVEMTCEAERD
jgi:hypothetical protein